MCSGFGEYIIELWLYEGMGIVGIVFVMYSGVVMGVMFLMDNFDYFGFDGFVFGVCVFGIGQMIEINLVNIMINVLFIFVL